MNASAQPLHSTSSIDQLSMFLPLPAKLTVQKAAQMLQDTQVPVNDVLDQLLAIGDMVISSGLQKGINSLESITAKIYDSGIVEQMGSLNPFLRDGFEIGLQLTLNTLKSLTSGDVAKIVGIALVAFVAPNMILLNGPDYLQMISSLLMKLWYLP